MNIIGIKVKDEYVQPFLIGLLITVVFNIFLGVMISDAIQNDAPPISAWNRFIVHPEPETAGNALQIIPWLFGMSSPGFVFPVLFIGGLYCLYIYRKTQRDLLDKKSKANEKLEMKANEVSRQNEILTVEVSRISQDKHKMIDKTAAVEKQTAQIISQLKEDVFLKNSRIKMYEETIDLTIKTEQQKNEKIQLLMNQQYEEHLNKYVKQINVLEQENETLQRENKELRSNPTKPLGIDRDSSSNSKNEF